MRVIIMLFKIELSRCATSIGIGSCLVATFNDHVAVTFDYGLDLLSLHASVHLTQCLLLLLIAPPILNTCLERDLEMPVRLPRSLVLAARAIRAWYHDIFLRTMLRSSPVYFDLTVTSQVLSHDVVVSE